MLLRAVAALALAAGTAAHAAAIQAPCDDPSYARDFKVRYPGEVDKIWSDEQKQREGWNARAAAISQQMVTSGAATAREQSAFRLNLTKRPDIAALDGQIAKAAADFSERNVALQGVALISPLDPMRPNRAWCVSASSALDALRAKLAIEIQQWQLVDQALLANAASRGVHFDQ